MRTHLIIIGVAAVVVAVYLAWRGGGRTAEYELPLVHNKPSAAAKTVRVAAIQCYSRMGKTHDNCEMLAKLITQAAEQKARIVVLPECAVQGYMNPPLNRVWSKKVGQEENELPVELVAETVPGPASRRFSALAKQLGIYLALPLIEVKDHQYFNTLLLLDPAGAIVAQHRKQNLWPPGDGQWVSEGNLPPQVVATPFGRLGLMICYDVHVMPPKLKAAHADIVCYAIGWFGPNTENWFREIFPRRYAAPNNFAVIAANWSGPAGEDGWEGIGYSSVIARDGTVLAMAKTTEGSEIVCADLPLSADADAPAGEQNDE